MRRSHNSVAHHDATREQTTRRYLRVRNIRIPDPISETITKTTIQRKTSTLRTYNVSEGGAGIGFLGALATGLRVQEERAHGTLRLVGIL
jgi:c-di-GMP-binding flagellar brake protein YcgR